MISRGSSLIMKKVLCGEFKDIAIIASVFVAFFGAMTIFLYAINHIMNGGVWLQAYHRNVFNIVAFTLTFLCVGSFWFFKSCISAVNDKSKENKIFSIVFYGICVFLLALSSVFVAVMFHSPEPFNDSVSYYCFLIMSINLIIYLPNVKCP